MYTNYKRIRQEAGIYNETTLQPLLGEIDGSNKKFYVDGENVGDIIKFVSTIGTTNAQFGVTTSDVKVYCGLSGVYGLSLLGVSSIDAVTGMVELSVAPESGASVVATFVSSCAEDERIAYYQNIAENAINNVLSGCYEVPLSKTVYEVEDLAAKLAAAHWLINNHGVANPDTSTDGYRLFDYVVGLSEGSGRLYDLCKAGQMVASDGSIISATKESGSVSGSNNYVSGYAGGQLFTIKDETFRFNDFDSNIGTTGASEDNLWGC